ncbi:hypothetical protein HYC85_028907 [Camellia sinensis]|uniref:Uncharacterized protein n=1 Tax=Camellia sinensis TaxID=4442 RepID=A0A7J7G0F8_CAMSI|nr:hypothetical protein HYC85_028907 [Camellia sinensis]
MARFSKRASGKHDVLGAPMQMQCKCKHTMQQFLSKNAKQQLYFMQLGMRRIAQFSSRLTRRRYDTCAIRLVTPASNEPYIQCRA